MPEKSPGQTLLLAVESFICRYVHFPAEPVNQSLVLALWTLHTWIYQRFSATPYLAITARTKQSGKTLCMETLSLLCRGAKSFATIRMLAVVRLAEAYSAELTCFFDEAEQLSRSAAGDLRSLMMAGYRRGQTHPVTTGKTTIEYPVYFPKVFACIGDPNDTLRDRSLPCTLERGKPTASLHAEYEMAQGNAHALIEQFRAYMLTVDGLPQKTPEFLEGRNAEISTVLWSLALALRLDRQTTDRLVQALSDMCAMKTTDARRYTEAQADEDKTQDRTYAERALRDVLRTLRDDERAVFSSVAVDRLIALPDGPWRFYRGVPLDQPTLTGLLATMGVRSLHVRMGDRRSKQLQGYRRDAMLRAVGHAG